MKLSELINKRPDDATDSHSLAADTSHFFIVGCVRSGTTLLRDLLREHALLACPEENHMFRWSWPFRTARYRDPYEKQAIFKTHQEMDGVPTQKVTELLNTTDSRAAFLDAYCQAFMEAKGLGKRIWYEKTPQNIYGMLLIRGEMPGVKFLNIVRNPLNVVASLRKGLIMEEKDLVAACAYWREAVLIASQYRQAFPDEIHWIYYEDLIEHAKKEMKAALDFLGLPFSLPTGFDKRVHPERNQYREVLTEEDQLRVQELCAPILAQCGLRDYFDGFVPSSLIQPVAKASPAPKKAASPMKVPKAKGSKMPMNPGKWLPLEKSCKLIQETFELTPKTVKRGKNAQGPIPRTVFQFWDKKEMPPEISKLIEHNRALCKELELRHVLFDLESGEAFLREHFPPDYAQFWMQLPHPAMQSDLLRLCYLYQEGGYYLDADMAMRKEFSKLFAQRGRFLCFKWDAEGRENLCNWLIGSIPGHPCTRFSLQSCWHEAARACEKSPDYALANILTICGPGAFTKAVATFVSKRQKADNKPLPGMQARSVTFAYKHVMNGPELLKTNGMDYKKTELHWQVAAKKLS